MGSPLRRHMILMIMGGKNCIHLMKSKRVDNKGHIPQIRLHCPSAAHVCHLMSGFHFSIPMRALSIPAPQINGDIRIRRSLKPHAGASQPPHGYVSRFHHFVFNILNQPCSPFRESALNPALSCHFTNFTHNIRSALSSFYPFNLIRSYPGSFTSSGFSFPFSNKYKLSKLYRSIFSTSVSV